MKKKIEVLEKQKTRLSSCSSSSEEKEREDQATEYADWIEAHEEERRENAMQNCIDDMYSDCDSD